MGLDTRAYAKATPEWQEDWVKRMNAQGWRPVMFGLMAEPVGKRNYGLTGGWLEGREPFTIEDAPLYHQDGMESLPWPGHLIGGMLSENGGGPSFRGKAYDAYVQAVTGESLYSAIDEFWEGEQLLHITLQLELAAEGKMQPLESNIQSDPWDFGFEDVDAEERKALAAWFRVCVDNDLVVSGDA